MINLNARANMAMAADEAAADARVSPDLWAASCRPASGRGQLKSFAALTIINQPLTDRFFCHCERDPRQCEIFLRWQKRQAKGGCREGNAADERDKAHCDFYTHELPAADNTPTYVENLPALQLEIASIRRAWVLPPLGEVAGLPDAFASPQVLQPGAGGLLHGRRVVVYVHGWKQGYRRTLPMADLMRQKLGGRPAPARAAEEQQQEDETTAAAAAPPPCVVMFTWPARRGQASYAKARGNAPYAGERLRQLIIELQDAGCHVAVYGHSMGCRVILHALSAPEMVRERDSLVWTFAVSSCLYVS